MGWVTGWRNQKDKERTEELSVKLKNERLVKDKYVVRKWQP